MNFHQKLSVFITLIIMTATAGGAMLLGPAEPSMYFITKFSAIVFAELLLGISMISIQKMHRSNFLLNASSTWIDLLYLLFAVVMAFIPEGLLSLKNFIIIHVLVLLVVVLVMKLIYFAAFQDVDDQENKDLQMLNVRKQLYEMITLAADAAKQAFPDNGDLHKKCQTLTENLRYASDIHCNTASEFLPIFQNMQTAAAAKDEAAFTAWTDQAMAKDNFCRTQKSI